MDIPDVEPVAVEGRIRIPYRWPAGKAGGRFLAALRDESRLLGQRCPKCARVAVPPRPRCLSCGAVADEWVPVGPEGELVSWTVARGGPAPVAWGLVRLDGADTGVLHRLLDVAPEALKSGMRMRAVLDGRRTGQITDIAGFAPAGGATCNR
ncbi:MAG: Zn-ribbon domain-containing OB-fold protein [Planctomycetes bacterium]|nr:Zn-ribbon domain-containing OB-fold protein [Planctomycetota bacterium]